MDKVILVDMDDTVEHLCSAWIEELNTIYNLDVKEEDIWNWDLSIVYPTLTEQQIYAPLLEESLWQKVRLVDCADLYLKKLQEDGYNIYFVTSTHYKNIVFKIKYVMERYFPFIPIENLIVTHNKQMIKGDYLIDDNPDNLIGGDYTPILFTACHNRQYNKVNLNRVYNWKQVYEFIKGENE